MSQTIEVFPVPVDTTTTIQGYRIQRWTATHHRIIVETDDGRVWTAMRWFDGFLDVWVRSNTHSYERLLSAWERAEQH